MDTYNSLTAWIGWRFFLLSNVLARIFLFGSRAKQDIKSSKENLDAGTAYERQKQIEFNGFMTRVDVGDFTRNDIFLLMFILGAVYSNFSDLLELAVAPSSYLEFTAWGLMALGIGGLIWAALKRQYGHWPVSEKEYVQKLELLETVGMTARKPMENSGTVFVFLMLLVDAAMISIVAIDYAADLPRNLQLFGGTSVGVVFALCLVWITHHTGEQLFRGNHHDKLVKIIREERLNSEDHKTSALERKIRDFKIPFLIAEKRFFARYGWLVLTLIMITLIVGLATYARYNQNQNLLLSQLQDVIFAGSSDSQARSPRFLSQVAENMGTLTRQGFERQQKAMIAGISLLAIVFIIVQIVAITLSYRRSFALDGGEDRLAYDRIEQYQQQTRTDKHGNISLTRSQKIVVNKARKFLSAYFGALMNCANRENDTVFGVNLNLRGPHDFYYTAKK